MPINTNDTMVKNVPIIKLAKIVIWSSAGWVGAGVGRHAKMLLPAAGAGIVELDAIEAAAGAMSHDNLLKVGIKHSSRANANPTANRRVTNFCLRAKTCMMMNRSMSCADVC